MIATKDDKSESAAPTPKDAQKGGQGAIGENDEGAELNQKATRHGLQKELTRCRRHLWHRSPCCFTVTSPAFAPNKEALATVT